MRTAISIGAAGSFILDILRKSVVHHEHERTRSAAAASYLGLEVELFGQGQPMDHAQGEAHGEWAAKPEDWSILRTVRENEFEDFGALGSAPSRRRRDLAWPLAYPEPLNDHFHILVDRPLAILDFTNREFEVPS